MENKEDRHNLLDQAQKPDSSKMGRPLSFSAVVPRSPVARVVIGLVLFFLVVAGIWYMQYGRGLRGLRYGEEEIVGLVADKISASATIVIRVPDGIRTAEAKSKTSFDPIVAGSWLPEESSRKIKFQPSKPMKVGTYYAVFLATSEGEIRDEFLADEDPKVVAIFPKADAEASEYSAITVVFNRPMVPLTTLEELEKRALPVTITPETKGKFKWITTRNLQFIPEERLTRASNYTVSVAPGFVSMDGLSIPAFTHSFTTRRLRYEHLHEGTTIYNQPIRLTFNQPVDIDRLQDSLRLEDVTAKKTTPFIAEYARREVYDESQKKTVKAIDRSIVEVFNHSDRYDRQKLWDFEHTYRLSIDRAYPLEGSLLLEEKRTATIQVTRVIQSISATSERSTHVAQDFFDPEGKLWVSFYEDIDIERSEIKAETLKEIGYGEKCKEASSDQVVEYENIESCEKEPDHAKIFLILNAAQIGRSERIPLQFNKVVNGQGLQLNPDPILEIITAYHEFKIVKTVPEEGARGASVTELKLCTTSPIAAPTKEEWPAALSANLDVQISYWYETYRVSAGSPHVPCSVGEFLSSISYGLVPESAYKLTLNLTDDFGQRLEKTIEFTTGKVPEYSLNFYHFQNRYTVTSPGKTKLTYAAENMEYVDLHICKTRPPTLLEYLENRPGYTDASSTLQCEKTYKARIDLPKKFWIKNYFQVDIEEYVGGVLGHFVLSFSNPNYRESWGEKRQIYERTLLTITRLAVAEKRVDREGSVGQAPSDRLTPQTLAALYNLYWVAEVGTLNPVKGAEVLLYAEDKPDSLVLAARGTTDAQGIVKTKTVWNLRGAVVSAGSDSAIVIGTEEQKLQYASWAQAAERVYLYTDRPIYKPGDEVSLKGLYRIGYDGTYEIFRDKNVYIEVRNSSDEVIFSEEVPISDYGTFNARFILAKDTALGTYRMNALNGLAEFDVEEYVPAPFKIEAKTDRGEYIAGDSFRLDLAAEYYFGVPLEGGEVSYSIVSQDYFFDRHKGEYFDFGNPWYRCFEDCPYGDQFILRGKVALGADGKAAISHMLDFGKFFKSGNDLQSKIFVVYLTVQNPNGQSVSAQPSFIVHRGEFYLGLASDKSFFGKNEPFTLRVKSVDTEGKERAAQSITTELDRITWKNVRRQEVDGGYYWKWEKQREKILEEPFSTDARGNWQKQFRIEREGEYEAVVRAKDARQNPIENSTSLYVYGEGEVSIRPTNDTTLDIEAEKQTVDVGEEVRIVVKSPYERAKALIALERGQIFHYEIVDVTQNLYAYTFLVDEKHIPNVYTSVLLLSPTPEVKFGQVGFGVHTDRSALRVQMSANKKYYLPGEEVVLTIETKDYRNQPVPAEVSLAVVDVSVLALKGNPKKNPLVFFYGGFPLTVSTSSNVKNVLLQLDVPSLAEAAAPKGGGGLEPEDLARRKRGVFKDTAYWQAVVETDASGKKEVRFTLPDNLTSWQAELVGITKDTKVGVGYADFVSRKELMVVGLKPRFVVPGDTFLIGAKIFNETGKEQQLRVAFSSKTLAMTDDIAAQDVTIQDKGSQTIYFSVRAPLEQDKGSHSFVLSAGNATYEDTVEQAIPITRNDTYETVATAGFTRADSIKEFMYLPGNILKDNGGLTVESSATLAVFLSDALQYLAEYPYGCSEQIASKLSALAILKRALSLKNISDKMTIEPIEFDGQKYTTDEVVEIGLARIYENESSAGGFTYYTGLESNFWLTLHVVNALQDLKQAGYTIRSDVLERSAKHLFNRLTSDLDLKGSKDLVILTAYTLSRLEGFEHEKTFLANALVKPILDNQKFLVEDGSSASLAYLAMLTAEGEYPPELKERVYTVLENRIAIDGRGAYLVSHPRNTLWSYYETPVKDTALLLKALAADKNEHELLDKILRWLLRSRAKDGSWGSTNNTLTAIDAMTDYLEWQRETESDFMLDLLVDGQKRAGFDFNPQTILETFREFIPIANLKRGNIFPVTLTRTRRNELNNNFYYDMALKYYLPVDQIPPRDEGMTVTRTLHRLDDRENKNPSKEAGVGDILRVHLTITVPKVRQFVAIEDFIPAGVEIVNFSLATEDQTLRKKLYELGGRSPDVNSSVSGVVATAQSSFRDLWNALTGNIHETFSPGGDDAEFIYEESPRKQTGAELIPDGEERHNDRLFLFKESLQPGVYEFDYYVRALIPGTFHHLPVVASEMYFPENFGRTGGEYFTIHR